MTSYRCWCNIVYTSCACWAWSTVHEKPLKPYMTSENQDVCSSLYMYILRVWSGSIVLPCPRILKTIYTYTQTDIHTNNHKTNSFFFFFFWQSVVLGGVTYTNSCNIHYVSDIKENSKADIIWNMPKYTICLKLLMTKQTWNMWKKR